MTRLDKLINSYNRGESSLGDIEAFLRFDVWSEENVQRKAQNRVLGALTNQPFREDEVANVKNPEDTYIEGETGECLSDFFKFLRPLLSERDYNIFVDYYVYHIRQKALAEQHDMKRSAVSMVLVRANQRIKEIVIDRPEFGKELKAYLEFCSTKK